MTKLFRSTKHLLFFSAMIFATAKTCQADAGQTSYDHPSPPEQTLTYTRDHVEIIDPRLDSYPYDVPDPSATYVGTLVIQEKFQGTVADYKLVARFTIMQVTGEGAHQKVECLYSSHNIASLRRAIGRNPSAQKAIDDLLRLAQDKQARPDSVLKDDWRPVPRKSECPLVVFGNPLSSLVS